jgi:hypothetical protein
MKTFSFGACRVRGWLALAGGLAALLPGLLRGQSVVINEFLAVNRNTYFLSGTNTPAWVELYNVTTNNIDLGANGGWSLTDSLNSPRKFVFPPGTIIFADSFLVVYLDSRTNDPGIHVGFNVRDTGDDLTLFEPVPSTNAPTQRDRLVFGLQLIDLSVGRVPDGTGPFVLNAPSHELPNTPATSITSTNLKINEWMANPSGGDDWFELFNPETNVVDLSGLVWSDQLPTPATNRALAALSFIAPGGFIQFFASDLGKNDIDHVDFKLSSGSDRIILYASNRVSVIDQVSWTVAQQSNASEGRLPDGSTNIIRFAAGKATPEESNFQLITNVVINEVLSHTDPPFEDAIEIFNPTGTPQDISDWWLSNALDDPKKFRIPPNTVIPPFGFVVFYECLGCAAGQGFNTDGTGAGRNFTLNSAHGDQVVLHSASNDASGTLTGSRVSRAFGPAANSVSFGRYLTSDGKTEFVAMSRRTFGTDNPGSLPQFRTGTGLTNPYPMVGPLVISEIHYHPPDIVTPTNTVDDSTNEFIEILNITGTNVTLYDAAGFYFDNNVPPYGVIPYADGRTNTWRVRDAVDFEFPTNVMLAPGGYLLVVNFDPAVTAASNAFRARFNVPAGVPLFGPYRGKLSNGGGTIELHRPDPPQGPAHPEDFAMEYVPYILVEEIKYSDASPWPTNEVDGGGNSLQRIVPADYGNDPINWKGATPTAGRTNAPPAVAPTITADPQSLSLAEGADAAFSVTATGTAPLSFQWWFASMALAGETNAMLTVTNVDAGDAGSYRVVVTNVAGARTSAVATLNVNRTPAFSPGGTNFFTLYVGESVRFTNTATDADGPAGALRFSLDGGAPDGARVDATNGIFRWRPTAAQAGTTNVITLRVTDGGTPPASGTRTITVIVWDYLAPGLGFLVLRAGENRCVPMELVSSAGLTNAMFDLDYPADRLTNLWLTATIAEVRTASVQEVSTTRSRVQFETQPGQVLQGTQIVAQLCFTALSNRPSAFVPLTITAIEGRRSDGLAVTNPFAGFGRLVVVGEEPLLESLVATNGARSLVVYGNPGATNWLEYATNLNGSPNWQAAGAVTLTNLMLTNDGVVPAGSFILFRAVLTNGMTAPGPPPDDLPDER